jgi:hypothetical protein
MARAAFEAMAAADDRLEAETGQRPLRMRGRRKVIEAFKSGAIKAGTAIGLPPHMLEDFLS